MEKVSLVITNFNRFDLLEDCIESIYKYTKDVDFEIIAADNNSTKGSPDAIIKRFPDVIWSFTKENFGYAYATNKGLEKATGKYLLFINNDIVFLENTLKITIDFYKTLKRPALIGCKLFNADMTHQASVVDFDNLWNLAGENFFLYKLFPKCRLLNRYYINDLDLKETTEVDILKGAFIFGETEYINKMGGFDTRFYLYGEEHDMCKKFKENYGDVYYFPKTGIIHFGGATTHDIPWVSIYNNSVSKIKMYKMHFKGVKLFLALLIHYSGLLIRVPVYFIWGIFAGNKSLFKKSKLYFKVIFNNPKI